MSYTSDMHLSLQLPDCNMKENPPYVQYVLNSSNEVKLVLKKKIFSKYKQFLMVAKI